MSVVTVSRLERDFGDVRVLRSIDLVVGAGERVAITGPNGSGKTTLLRVLAGLLRPTSGDIAILGRSPGDVDVRRRIAVIGHVPSLYPKMTPFENLRFWAGIYDDPSATARGRDILAQLGLDPDDDRPVGSYSQGMRQRVSIARALSTDPELVLADEPLAALDADGANGVAAMLADRGRTLIAATHDAQLFEGSRRMELADGTLRTAS